MNKNRKLYYAERKKLDSSYSLIEKGIQKALRLILEKKQDTDWRLDWQRDHDLYATYIKDLDSKIERLAHLRDLLETEGVIMPYESRYKRSLSYKVRKALGFTNP